MTIMFKIFILLTLCMSMFQANAKDQLKPGEDDIIFHAKQRHLLKTVKWVVVEDLEQACFGHPPNPGEGELRGCAKFTPKSCTIYTKRRTSLANLGHEVRHCFEGRWHN